MNARLEPAAAGLDLEDATRAALAQDGYALLPGEQAGDLLAGMDCRDAGGSLERDGAHGWARDGAQDWSHFQASWQRLELDRYMADGGTYRYRRHATYSAQAGARVARQEPHQPHYQSRDYNPLNGGIARHFAPIEPEIAQGPVLQAVLSYCCELFSSLAPGRDWHIEVHQFRIDAARTGATPTPEGVHRDGVDFVFMMLVQRLNLQGGETRILDLSGQTLARFTLAEPMDTAIVNDTRVRHGVTPIQPLDPAQPAWRDMLVVTFASRPAAAA
jgi:hypothetical protein